LICSKKTIMRKIVLTYGIISGIIVTTIMLISIAVMQDKNNFETGEVIGYTSMVLALALIFPATKTYRDKEQNGTITFGRAFMLGLYITLIAGCIYAIGWEVYYRNSGGNFMEQYMQHYEQQMRESGTAQAQIDEEMTRMKAMGESYKNPVIRFGFTLMEILPVGILVSLISAFLLKRKTQEAI
jgi:hypothetical protein